MPDCRYFDGRSSRARAASATVEDGALRLSGDGVDRVVAAGDLGFAPATGDGPARIAFADGGLCEFDDRAGAAALFAALGHHPSIAERVGASPSRLVLVVLAFVAAMAALYVWGVPLATDLVVDRAPRSFDAALGAHELEALDARGIFRPTLLPQARRDAIVARFDALRSPPEASGDRTRIAIQFRTLGVPNAFALPGDLVVVSDEIVELAGDDDDALSTVLAHEAGHIAHRDALRQTVRAALVSVLAAWYIGDVSNAAAVVAGGIGTMRYSRDAEHAADVYALHTMQANGRTTRGAAALFRRLQDWRPPDRRKRKADASARAGGDAKADPDAQRSRFELPEYLSTHPATDARIRLFETGVETPGAAD